MADTGRPLSYKTEDIKEVINQYIRFTDGRVLLNASKVAEYAQKELHLFNFKYYVINRNADAKQYLSDMNDKIKGTLMGGTSTKASVFRTIDVLAFSTFPKERLIAALNGLNEQMENMSEKYAEIIKENMQLRCQIADMTDENQKKEKAYQEEKNGLKEKNQTLKQQIDELKNKYVALSESVHIAWDKESETILKKTGLFEDDTTGNTSSAVITSPTDDVVTVDFRKASDCRKKFLDELEDL